MSSKKMPKQPKWLSEYREKTAIIEVISMAFDSKFTDAQVRKALRDVAATVGKQFAPVS